MTADAASAACCCGGGGGGGLTCPEWLSCAPATLNFVASRAVTTHRRYPAGGQYTDTISFSGLGTMTLGIDGVYRGSITCSSAYRNEYEAVANGIHFEEDGQQPCGNPWGCPNLDCCATFLAGFTEVVTEPWTMGLEMRCTDVQGGFGANIRLSIIDDGAQVQRTTTRTTVFCPPPDVPNPQVETEVVSKTSAWATGGIDIPLGFDLPSECLPTDFFAPYNYDQTSTQTSAQESDLTCYRLIFVPPWYELVGTCTVTGPNGELGVPLNCGDIVATVRDVRVVTLG